MRILLIVLNSVFVALNVWALYSVVPDGNQAIMLFNVIAIGLGVGAIIVMAGSDD